MSLLSAVSLGEQGEEGLHSRKQAAARPVMCPHSIWPPCPPFPVPDCQQERQGSQSDTVTFYLHCHPCYQCLLSEWDSPWNVGGRGLLVEMTPRHSVIAPAKPR